MKRETTLAFPKHATEAYKQLLISRLWERRQKERGQAYILHSGKVRSLDHDSIYIHIEMREEKDHDMLEC